jgi:Fic family protein
MARLWQTALLMQWRQLFQFLPLESQIQKFQNDYYSAIAFSHKSANSNFFVEFLLEKIYEILCEVDDGLNITD